MKLLLLVKNKIVLGIGHVVQPDDEVSVNVVENHNAENSNILEFVKKKV